MDNSWLKKPLQQVVGFSLLEAIIPFTWFPVRNFVFHWNLSSDDVATTDNIIIMPDGFYTLREFVDKLNDDQGTL